MSSAGVAVAPPQSYFCYQCNRTVTLTPVPNSDLACPNCSGGFLEESNSTPSILQNSNPHPISLIVEAFLGRPSSFNAGGPAVVSSTTFDRRDPNLPAFSDGFDPVDFLHNHLSNLRQSGASVEFVVQNSHGDRVPANFGDFFVQGDRLPANFGDYFFGPGLEQLIQQLAENDPNRYGTPPATKQAIGALPNVVITDDIVNSESNSCAVCMNEFEIDLSAKQMPCKHLYHSDCLVPWLQLHNSCPVCRYELPTDDADYENRRTGGGQGGSSERSTESRSGGGEAQREGRSDGGSGGGERSFTVTLPWFLRGFGSSRGNNDGNDGGSSSGAQQDGGGSGSHDSETYYESLD